jgi:hypothetical protein
MAQTIYCDNGDAHPDGPPPHDWLVSQAASGETMAWCNACYVLLCRAVVADADAQAPQPEPEPEPAPEPDADDEDGDDAEAIARLEAAGQARTAADSAEGSTPPDAPSGAPGPADEAPAGPRVVKRGTSPSRKAHEARKRRKARKPAAEPEPEPAQEVAD